MSEDDRDYQKARVYKWEEESIFPTFKDKKVSIELAKILVDHIWSEIGRENPPEVVEITNRRKVVKNGAVSFLNFSYGARYKVEMHKNMKNEAILIHELAHSLNLCEDRNANDGHGPCYVADYIFLLVKFCGFNAMSLLYSARNANVDVNETVLFQHLKG